MARKTRKLDFVPMGTVQEAAADSRPIPMYRAGLYARLSFESERNRDSNTIETQMELLNRFVSESTDIVAEKRYFDISQTGTDFDRSGFDEMMKDIRDGRINCVIVKDLSRLGRNYIEAGDYIERVFPFFEVRFIAVNDGFDSSKSEAGLMVSMSNIFNEYYSRDLAKKVKAAYASGWSKGQYVSGTVAYGLMKDPVKKGHLIHDPQTVGNVVRMFDLFLAGAGYQEIAHIFNKEGILNSRAYKYYRKHGVLPTTFDTRWFGVSIRQLLTNRIYTGDGVFGRYSYDSFRDKKLMREPEENWLIVPDTHEAVVPREVFDRTQEEIQRRKTEREAKIKDPGVKSVAAQNLFKGKIFCADCGKAMYLQWDWQTCASYMCATYVSKKECPSHRIHEGQVKKEVLAVIRTHISIYLDNMKMLRRINRKQESLRKFDLYGREISKCHREIAKLNRRKEQLYEDYANHLIDAEQYETFKNQDALREKELQARIAEITKYRAGCDMNFRTDEEWAALIEKYRNVQELSKPLVDAFVEKIEVHEDGKITVHLIYDDMLEELVQMTKKRKAETEDSAVLSDEKKGDALHG